MCILYYYAQTTDVQSSGAAPHRNVYYMGCLLYYLVRRALDNAYIIIYKEHLDRNEDLNRNLSTFREEGVSNTFSITK